MKVILIEYPTPLKDCNITNDILIFSVSYKEKNKRIKLKSERGCGYIEEPYIDEFITFLKSNGLLKNHGITIEFNNK